MASERKIRISHIIDSLGPGGKEKQLTNLAIQLCDVCDVQIIVLSNKIHYKEIYCRQIQVDSTCGGKLRGACRVMAALRNFKPDIVQIWNDRSILKILPYALLHSIKVVNSTIRYGGKLHLNLIDTILRKLALSLACTVVSNSNRGLRVTGIEGKKNTRVIYNGITVEKGNNLQGEIADILEKHRHRIIMVGQFRPAKDYITLIQTAKRICHERDDVGFFLVGDGPGFERARDEAGELLDKHIYFLGRRQDIQSILCSFSIGVLLNNTNGHAEGLSNAIMEYMIKGLPVVATNAGGTPEIVDDGVTGFLVPAFSPSSVAESLKKLFADEALARRMGEEGQKKIKIMFSVEKMAGEYLKLYKELI